MVIPLFWLTCTKAKMLQNLCYQKSGTVSRYPESGGTPICPICTSVKSFNEYYYFKIVSIFKMWSHVPVKNIASDKDHFEDFPKEKGSLFFMPCFAFWSCFVTFCYTSPNIFCSKDKNFEFYNSFPTFWGKKWNLLFICHYLLLLFTVTIHLLLFISNFCLFKGGCPLYLKQVFSVLSSGLLS